ITERFTRNLMGHLTSWQLNDHAALTFEHDLRGQEIARKSDAGFYQTLGYTQTGMLTKQAAGDHHAQPDTRHKSLQRQWLYDHAYNLTMISDSLRGSAFNSVTANDQISHATWTGSGPAPMCEERFTYDKNLNITRRQTWVNEVLESESHQQQQQGRVVYSEHKGWRHQTHRINPDTGKPEEGKFVRVVNEHNITWKYDVNGRLIQKLVDKGGYRPLQWRYRWDAKSQLTGLETPEGERWEYKYDPFGRRISKRCTNRDKPGINFHWNGDQLAEEIPVGADGKPEDENAIRWIYEPGSFTPLARYEKGHLHYAVTDTVGRIQELLTEEGTIVWKGKPQLWGKEDGRNQEDAPSCRLRFPGQYEDDESGLFYNRFRYYDGDTGQYVSPDPIGLEGGTNPYGYVSNPLKWIDPLGLCKTDVNNDGPLLPDSAWHKNAPHQVTPGTRELEHYKFNPDTGELEYSTIKYDQYGRQIQRTDYTNHGYGNPSAPDYHSNPHVHDYEYGPGYSPKGKQTRTNTGVN
ncbi:MAG: RHS repeat domain-containing protein, partial [Hafnia alvei]